LTFLTFLVLEEPKAVSSRVDFDFGVVFAP